MRIEGGFANSPLSAYRSVQAGQTNPVGTATEPSAFPQDDQVQLSKEGVAQFDAQSTLASEAAMPPNEPLTGNGGSGGDGGSGSGGG